VIDLQSVVLLLVHVLPLELISTSTKLKSTVAIIYLYIYCLLFTTFGISVSTNLNYRNMSPATTLPGSLLPTHEGALLFRIKP
jgi:hypothetical protein